MKPTMKIPHFSIALLCCALVACHQPDAPIDDGELQQASTIKAGSFTVAADVERAVFDRSISLTTKCMPLVTGKGVIGLHGMKSKGNVAWTLDSPYVDTVSVLQESSYTIYIPVEFKANSVFEQEWVVHLVPQSTSSYLFSAHIHIDSVFIADSNRMYWIQSEVAKKYCPRRLGWQPDAVSRGSVYLYS
jgi:hypothetical protein